MSAGLGVAGFVLVIALVLLRLPVAIAMGVVGYLGPTLTAGAQTSGFMLGRATFEAVFPYSLSVVPLVVLMGVFAGHAGLSRALYGFVATLSSGTCAAGWRWPPWAAVRSSVR
jgi:hypothetical protein